MESDIRSLLIGIVGGLIVLAIVKIFKTYQRKSIKDDIEMLEYEKEHLAEMKNSSVEMSRSSFRSIFMLFIFLGSANLIPSLFTLTNLSIGSFMSVVLWGMMIALSVRFWRRYDNLKNYKDAVEKIDKKLTSLREKLNTK